MKSVKNISERGPFFSSSKTQILQLTTLKECKLRYRNHAILKTTGIGAKRDDRNFRIENCVGREIDRCPTHCQRAERRVVPALFSDTAGSNKPVRSANSPGFKSVPNPAPHESEILIVKRFSSNRMARSSWAHYHDGSSGSSASIESAKAVPVSSHGCFTGVVLPQSVEACAERFWDASEGIIERLISRASCAENVAKSAISIPSSRTMSEFT